MCAIGKSGHGGNSRASRFAIFAICLAFLVGIFAIPQARADLIFDINYKKNVGEDTPFAIATVSQPAANTVNVEVVGQNAETFKGQLFFTFNLIGFGVGESTLTATTLPNSNFYWYEDGGTNPPGQVSPPDPAAFITLNGNVNFSYGLGCLDQCGPGGSEDDTSSFEFTLTGIGLEVEDFIRSFFTDSKGAALFIGVDTQPSGARFAASYRCVDSEDPNGHMCDDDPGQNEIPEPTTLALFGAGLLAYISIRRRRRYLAA